MDEDGEVVKVSEGEPESDRLLNSGNCQYVLEVNYGSGIQKGDRLEMEDCTEFEDETDEDDEYTMMVLDAQGDEQYKLMSGERIFSRPSTRMLLIKAKRAWNGRKSKDADDLNAALGRYAFKELDKQDSNKKEYVVIESIKN
jgi:uncharacterized protein YecT (DUF1311 family)